jgi:hypothetical protein
MDGCVRSDMIKRWVIWRKADGKYWTGDLGKEPWMMQLSEAKPLRRQEAMKYSNMRRWGQKAVPVWITLSLNDKITA